MLQKFSATALPLTCLFFISVKVISRHLLTGKIFATRSEIAQQGMKRSGHPQATIAVTGVIKKRSIIIDAAIAANARPWVIND